MAGQATQHIVGPCGCAMEKADDDSVRACLIALMRDKQSRRAVLVGALINAASVAYLLAKPPDCLLQLAMALA